MEHLIEQYLESLHIELERLGHEVREVFPTVGLLGEPINRRIIGFCVKCGETILITKNPRPKPLLFGRKSWTAWRLEGLPARYYCKYLQTQKALIKQLEQGEQE